jgi:protein TonB
MPIPSSHQNEQPGTMHASQVVAVAHESPQVGPPELDPDPEPEPDPDPELDPDPEAMIEQSENVHWPHAPLAGPSELPGVHLPVSPHQPHPEPAVVQSPHDDAPAQLAASGATHAAEKRSPSARVIPPPSRSLALLASGEDGPNR